MVLIAGLGCRSERSRDQIGSGIDLIVHAWRGKGRRSPDRGHRWSWAWRARSSRCNRCFGSIPIRPTHQPCWPPASNHRFWPRIAHLAPQWLPSNQVRWGLWFRPAGGGLPRCHVDGCRPVAAGLRLRGPDELDGTHRRRRLGTSGCALLPRPELAADPALGSGGGRSHGLASCGHGWAVISRSSASSACGWAGSTSTPGIGAVPGRPAQRPDLIASALAAGHSLQAGRDDRCSRGWSRWQVSWPGSRPGSHSRIPLTPSPWRRIGWTVRNCVG